MPMVFITEFYCANIPTHSDTSSDQLHAKYLCMCKNNMRIGWACIAMYIFMHHDVAFLLSAN